MTHHVTQRHVVTWFRDIDYKPIDHKSVGHKPIDYKPVDLQAYWPHVNLNPPSSRIDSHSLTKYGSYTKTQRGELSKTEAHSN